MTVCDRICAYLDRVARASRFELEAQLAIPRNTIRTKVSQLLRRGLLEVDPTRDGELIAGRRIQLLRRTAKPYGGTGRVAHAAVSTPGRQSSLIKRDGLIKRDALTEALFGQAG